MAASSAVGLDAGISGQWGVAEAKAHLSEVVQKALDEGPQEITKNGRPVAVLISMEEWKAEYGRTARKGSIVEFFQSSPLKGSGIRVGRIRLDPRRVDF